MRTQSHPQFPAQSIDDLDAAICTLAAKLNAETHRLLTLVREFDDRMGWSKWSFLNCAEWLAWRCGISLSAAREKVRTAQALRCLPAIGAAFAEGRLSYSKVRALTRVVEWHDEDVLLRYALTSTAAQVEERCRQIRNGRPESAGIAQRAWERRAVTLFRDPARGVIRMSVELPIEEGEAHLAGARSCGRGGRGAGGRRVRCECVARAAGRCARRDREALSRGRRNRELGYGRSLPGGSARRRSSPPRRDRSRRSSR